MRKRVAIAGHSDEGLSLIPLLEANPEIEVCAIYSPDTEAARRGLERLDARLASRLVSDVTSDEELVLRVPGLVAIIDAELAPGHQRILNEAPDRGIQVTTPLIAKLLYAFGPVDASHKPDLLATLSEILESYNLTVDRGALLNRILQIAVGSTGADRGSLMLYYPAEGCLRVEVAIGIEREVLPKIRIQPGEGIAGRAYAEARPILVTGTADYRDFSVLRQRSDVASAISAPLVHQDCVLGVLNLSHSTQLEAFNSEDLEFVEKLAAIDAKIITRAEDYRRLRRDSASLRLQNETRSLLGRERSFGEGLPELCRHVAEQLGGGVSRIFLSPNEWDQGGLHTWVWTSRKTALLTSALGGGFGVWALVPLEAAGELVGLLSHEAVMDEAPSSLWHEELGAVTDALAVALRDSLREQRMEREARRNAALTQAAARMSEAHESEDLHGVITKAAASLLDAEHAMLRIQDTTTGQFQLCAYFGAASADEQPRLLELEKLLSIRCLREQSPVNLSDLTGPEFPDPAGDVGCALVWPLRRAGCVFGSLAVLGRSTCGPGRTDRFDPQDLDALERLAEHAQATLIAAQERQRTRSERRFDVVTGLPNASQLAERIAEEIARSRAPGRGFALISVRLPALDDLCAASPVTAVDQLIISLAQEIRAAVRDFDVLARSGEELFELLLPEPEAAPTAVIAEIARRLRSALATEIGESAADAKLEFGYALFPDDAFTPEALQQCARRPRVVAD